MLVRRLILVLIAVMLLAAARQARACADPVYAKFYEEEYPYDYLVLYYDAEHQGDQEVVDQLKKLDEDYTANVAFEAHDAANADEWEEDSLPGMYWRLHNKPALPFYVVVMPGGMYLGDLSRGEIYAGGELTGEMVGAMISSPKRVQMARMLAGEKHGVLLLLKGDNELENLRASLTVAAATAQDVDDEDEPVDTGWMTVSRDDPAERWFVKQLLCNPAIPQDSTEPMLFAIFGRGLMLQPLVGSEIVLESVNWVVTQILVASCSCIARDELKRASVYALLKFDWDEQYGREVPHDEPYTGPGTAAFAQFLAAGALGVSGIPVPALPELAGFLAAVPPEWSAMAARTAARSEPGESVVTRLADDLSQPPPEPNAGSIADYSWLVRALAIAGTVTAVVILGAGLIVVVVRRGAA